MNIQYDFEYLIASSKNNMPNVNFNDMQRQMAEFQRQYLLEFSSLQHQQQQGSSSSNRQNNWKP